MPDRSQGRSLFLAFIIIVNVVMGIWLVAGFIGVGDAVNDCEGEVFREACESGTAVGGTIGIGIILVVWAAVDAILAALWVVTRGERQAQRSIGGRVCPHCASIVPPSAAVCRYCQRDLPAHVVPAGYCPGCGAPPPRPPSPVCSNCHAQMPA